MDNLSGVGDKGTTYNHTPLASNIPNIVKLYPTWKPVQDTTAMIDVQPTDPESLLGLGKKPFEEIQRAKGEEAFIGIGKYLDEALKDKVEKDENLRMILVSTIPQISTYLNKNVKRYRLWAQIWRDIELEDWEENVIILEVEYENHEEKMKIWKDLCDVAYKIDTNANFLVEVKRLKEEK
jgi:hypothetical protein